MSKLKILIITMIFMACSSEDLPKGILTRKEMTPILVQIHLAEGLYAQRYMQNITREGYQDDLYLSTMKRLKVNQKAFEASVLYYGKYPEKYKLIYDEVLNQLNELEVKSRVKDSLSRISPPTPK
ncbi:MAG: DUF4296 domain-containing protein [Bacteroidia bacterium]|nr:DUF4296 domain-containing protein [Bacteroidia bacterium]